jgi:hypothetical protein
MSRKTVKAPFTEEQVKRINEYQDSGRFHAFTCMSHPVPECERTAMINQGTLVASETGLTCPCGKYTQDWVHEFMTQPLPPDPFAPKP